MNPCASFSCRRNHKSCECECECGRQQLHLKPFPFSLSAQTNIQYSTVQYSTHTLSLCLKKLTASESNSILRPSMRRAPVRFSFSPVFSSSLYSPTTVATVSQSRPSLSVSVSSFSFGFGFVPLRLIHNFRLSRSFLSSILHLDFALRLHRFPLPSHARSLSLSVTPFNSTLCDITSLVADRLLRRHFRPSSELSFSLIGKSCQAVT